MKQVKKIHVNLSLPVGTNSKLEEIAVEHNMTKSGLVNFWVNQALANNGNIFK